RRRSSDRRRCSGAARHESSRCRSTRAFDRPTRRPRLAVAGVRQPRHVQELRRSRQAVRSRGPGHVLMNRDWDYPLGGLWLVAVTIGLVMVASASYPRGVADGDPAHFVVRHGAYLLAGTIALGVCATMSLRVWLKLHRALLIAVLAMAVLVLIPGIGHM